AAAAALVAGGCIHVHTDADGKLKPVELKGAGAKAEARAADPGVQPAAATVPAPAVPAAASGLAKLAPKLGSLTAGSQPAVVTVVWKNRISQLPDPTRNGVFGNGLVGQMFLIGPKSTHYQADGKLTVDLFDETPQSGAPRSERLGSWTFPKEVLRALVTTDERFGKCYALFLPWPTYTPAVSRVKLTARFDPEVGFPIYAEPVIMTIDTSTGGEGLQVTRTTTLTPPSAPGPIVMPANPPAGPAPGAFPPAIPIYPPSPGANGPAPGPTAGVPPGLPPIAITVPPR
ncbi:hypothetical protein J0H58_36495, partial [bacterium]|nr:hypothetical protein [bacterium]